MTLWHRVPKTGRRERRAHRSSTEVRDAQVLEARVAHGEIIGQIIPCVGASQSWKADFS
jgi:hypothetical protein